MGMCVLPSCNTHCGQQPFDDQQPQSDKLHPYTVSVLPKHKPPNDSLPKKGRSDRSRICTPRRDGAQRPKRNKNWGKACPLPPPQRTVQARNKLADPCLLAAHWLLSTRSTRSAGRLFGRVKLGRHSGRGPDPTLIFLERLRCILVQSTMSMRLLHASLGGGGRGRADAAPSHSCDDSSSAFVI